MLPLAAELPRVDKAPGNAVPDAGVFDRSVLGKLPMVTDGSQPGCADAVLAMHAGRPETTIGKIEAALQP